MVQHHDVAATVSSLHSVDVAQVRLPAHTAATVINVTASAVAKA